MSSGLVDSDAPALLLLGLRDSDAQNTILQVRRNTVLVDRRREAEGPRELAHGALRNPEAFLGLLLLLLLLVCLGDLGALFL